MFENHLNFVSTFSTHIVQSTENYIDASIQIEHGEQRRFSHYQTHVKGLALSLTLFITPNRTVSDPMLIESIGIYPRFQF